MNKRSHLHKKPDFSASNPVRSQFQSRPNIAQAKPQSQKPLTQTQTEDGEFQQQKFEATKLELQAKYGTITTEGQEQLTVLQAKMSGLLQRRLEQASSKGSNFANIPISLPDTPSQLAVQTKLTIGEPGDKYEKEADKFAEQLDKLTHAPASGQAAQNLQHEEMSVEEKEIQRKPTMLQLRAAEGGMTATAGLETAINQARGGGQPLADQVRKPMEQFLGADFSRVKVHTDQKADQLSRAIQARAFTTGQDIFFAKGEYNPGSREGKKLIFHEGGHVAQQNGGAVQKMPNDEAVSGLNEIQIQEEYRKFAAAKRPDKLKEIVWEGHLQAISEVCKKYKYTIAVRETGPLSIKRIAEVAKAKPHTILEKSIKESSLKRGHENNATEVLRKLVAWDLDGFVGHWNANNELIGVRIDKIPPEVRRVIYMETDGNIRYVPLNVNSSLQSGGGFPIKQLQKLEGWQRYLYTGDYDLHEAYSAGAGGGQIPEATQEKVRLLNRLNQGIESKGTNSTMRSGEAKLEGNPKRVHVEGDYAMFQHGDQATYRMNQHLEAKALQSEVAQLVSAVATESNEPIAWCRMGEWFVTLEKHEHDVFRMVNNIKKPHTWSDKEDQRTKVGKHKERYQ